MVSRSKVADSRLRAFADGTDARLERALRQAVRAPCATPRAHRARDRPRGRRPALHESLAPLAREYGVVLGGSNVRRGAAATGGALAEAGDAAFVGLRLLADGGVLLYGEMGAYRYLVGPLRDGARGTGCGTPSSASRPTTATAARSCS